jgi:hypothetical protein
VDRRVRIAAAFQSGFGQLDLLEGNPAQALANRFAKLQAVGHLLLDRAARVP